MVVLLCSCPVSFTGSSSLVMEGRCMSSYFIILEKAALTVVSVMKQLLSRSEANSLLRFDLVPEFASRGTVVVRRERGKPEE